MTVANDRNACEREIANAIYLRFMTASPTSLNSSSTSSQNQMNIQVRIDKADKKQVIQRELLLFTSTAPKRSDSAIGVMKPSGGTSTSSTGLGLPIIFTDYFIHSRVLA